MAIRRADSPEAPGEEPGWVRAAAGGDASAWAALYDRYAPLVRAVCYDATGDPAEAQDLAQEVFLRALAGLSDLRRPERFGAWLVAIARLACLEWRRDRARRRRGAAGLRAAGAAGARAVDSSGTDPPGHEDDVRRLHAALLRLPEKERAAVQAFYLLGESVERARAAVGLSRSGLYRALERARKRLKRLLEGGCDDQ